MHLLLASQRLEEGRLRGLDTHLSYRIGLQTFSAAESRIVLGVPDAYELPTAPGNGYLKFDTTGLVRFKAAYVSGPVRDPRRRRGRPRLGGAAGLPAAPAAQRPGADRGRCRRPDADARRWPGRRPTPTTTRAAAPDPARASRSTGSPGRGVPAHEVWLPPLDDPPSLDQLLPRGSVRGPSGRDAAGCRPTAFLQVPLGWVDRPLRADRGAC